MNEERVDDDYEAYVLNNIGALMSDGTLSDVTFIVEDTEMHGVRSMFAAQSIVFKRMLYGAMLEANPSTEVQLSDLTVDAFSFLRDSFYNIPAVLSASLVVDVLFAAQKYMISPLVSKCVQFIKSEVREVADWFLILRDLEGSKYPGQSKQYLLSIINEGVPPFVLLYKSLPFLQSAQFEQLHADTIAILLSSDSLAAREHEIWEALIKWSRVNQNQETDSQTNLKRSDKQQNIKSIACDCVCDEDDEKEEKGDSDENSDSSSSAVDATKVSIPESLIRYIRFNQMDVAYLRERIVDQSVLSPQQIIDIMFARENAAKWKSAFNDAPRSKSKTLHSFQLTDIALTVEERAVLGVGDLVDFRDSYGLFCAASIIETDHERNRLKIHYTEWGRTYDEWWLYDESDAASAPVDKVRMVKYGAITGRKVQRDHFKQQIQRYRDNGYHHGRECLVNFPASFWLKNENYIDNQELRGKWVKANIVGFKTAKKYSDHLKVSIYINEDHFEYWIHPDNEQEIRPIE